MEKKKKLKKLCDWIIINIPNPKPIKKILNQQMAILEKLCEIIEKLLVQCKCKLKALCLLEDIKKKEKQVEGLTALFNRVRQAIFSNGKLSLSIQIHYFVFQKKVSMNKFPSKI